MKICPRLVILLIAVILPFQLVWAGASAYCQHEKSVSQVSHFGHHSHVHEASGTKSAAHGTPDRAASADNDCDICHAVSAPHLLQSVEAPTSFFASLSHASPLPHAFPASASLRAPDRPQWVRFAF